MALRDLFRKRPPVYVWDDVWEPHFLTFDDIPPASEFEWTCDDDHHYQLISLSYSVELIPIFGNTRFFGSLDRGQHRIMTWGLRYWNKAGILIETHILGVDMNLTSSIPNDWSFNTLPDNCFITPGMRVRLHADTLTGTSGFHYVTLYLRRWSIR